MKITRQNQRGFDVASTINLILSLGGSIEKIKAFGSWDDVNGDPWNTPCEVDLRVGDKGGLNHMVLYNGTEEPMVAMDIDATLTIYGDIPELI